MAQTLFEKIWDKHIVKTIEDGPSVLYIDTHFIHEVTSPQAFDGLRKRGIQVFNPERTTATPDHNVPTVTKERLEGVSGIKDKVSRLQVLTYRSDTEPGAHANGRSVTERIEQFRAPTPGGRRRRRD